MIGNWRSASDRNLDASKCIQFCNEQTTVRLHAPMHVQGLCSLHCSGREFISRIFRSGPISPTITLTSLKGRRTLKSDVFL